MCNVRSRSKVVLKVIREMDTLPKRFKMFIGRLDVSYDISKSHILGKKLVFKIILPITKNSLRSAQCEATTTTTTIIIIIIIIMVIIIIPDRVLINKNKITCPLVDFVVSADHRMKIKKREKLNKYQDLARELKKL